MPATPVVLIEPKFAEAVATVQYTTEVAAVIVDKFTVTNVTATPASITINLPTNLGAVEPVNSVLTGRTIDVGETYTCPELIGQVLVLGDIIATTASAADSLAIRVSGREIT